MSRVVLLEEPVIGIGTVPSPSLLDEELEMTGSIILELLEYDGLSFGASISSDEEESLLANWFGSSAVPATLSEQANEQNTAIAVVLTVENFLNRLIIAVLLDFPRERE